MLKNRYWTLTHGVTLLSVTTDQMVALSHLFDEPFFKINAVSIS